MRLRVRALRTLTWREWAAVCQIAARLPLAAVATLCLPLDRAQRTMTALPWAPRRVSSRRLEVLVEGVGRALRASCLTRALVLHGVLASAGEPSVVVLGARRDGGRLRAHAWVEHADLVLSPEGAVGYVPLCWLRGSGVRGFEGSGVQGFAGSRQ